MFNKKDKKEKDAKVASVESNGKVLTGVVHSTKMTDTAVVIVSAYTKHPVYGKFVKTQKKYKVHDAGNTLNVGDKVKISETTPISKDKRFVFTELLAKSATAELETMTPAEEAAEVISEEK